MSTEVIILIAIAVGIILIATVLTLGGRNRPRRRNRRLMRDVTGNVIALGATRVGEGTPLEGKGKFTGSPTQLKAGAYVISYELDTPTRIALIAQDDGGEETIMISSGAGLKEFELDVAGQYLWHVEPNVAASPWKFIYRPVKGRG